MRSTLFSFLLFSVGGCTADGFTAAIELRTDLSPGVEFDAARVTSEGRTVDHFASRDEDYFGGVRIAELDDLSPGNHAITVSLLDAEGPVVERTVQVTVTNNTAVTVVVARSCRAVACPATGGDPAHDTCVAGECVDPRCVDGGPYCPAAECSADADCPVGAACARAACEDGICFAIGDAAACGDGEYCDPDVGCRLLGGGDAGAMDATTPDTSAPDARPPDAGPSCGSERLLAMSARRIAGGDGTVIPAWDIVLSHTMAFPTIGDDSPITNGFTGVTEFRAEDAPAFHAVVDPFSNGRVSAPLIGIKPTGFGGGGYSPMSFSAPLTGTVITLVRRNIVSFSSVPGKAGGTDYDADVEWEYWGCDP